MKIASVSEIRRELRELPPEKLTDLCLALARFKKDNKELLHYILFESQDEESFILAIKQELNEDFAQLNTSSLYLAKKTIRKVLRKLNKYLRYSGDPTTSVELNTHFLRLLIETGLPIHTSAVLSNIFVRRLKIMMTAMGKMHPDLQFDYEADFQELSDYLNTHVL